MQNPTLVLGMNLASGHGVGRAPDGGPAQAHVEVFADNNLQGFALLRAVHLSSPVDWEQLWYEDLQVNGEIPAVSRTEAAHMVFNTPIRFAHVVTGTSAGETVFGTVAVTAPSICTGVFALMHLSSSTHREPMARQMLASLN